MPCFRGAASVDSLVNELTKLSKIQITPNNIRWKILEIILVWDGGEAELAARIRRLARGSGLVRPVFLTRNFGQHAATAAGMSISAGDWVVTMDEDGQHRGTDISIMLDSVATHGSLLCYSRAPLASKSRKIRDYVSKLAKIVAVRLLGATVAYRFQSFRLIEGQIAREVGAKLGAGVYLDIALSWYVDRPAVAEVHPIHKSDNTSSYSFRMLLSHFWRLFLSVGPAVTRLISFIGLLAAAGGILLGAVLSLQAVSGAEVPAGWTSQVVLTLVFSGLSLVLLGLLAEYLGQVQKSSMGRPTYAVAESIHPLEVQNKPLSSRSRAKVPKSSG